MKIWITIFALIVTVFSVNAQTKIFELKITPDNLRIYDKYHQNATEIVTESGKKIIHFKKHGTLIIPLVLTDFIGKKLKISISFRTTNVPETPKGKNPSVYGFKMLFCGNTTDKQFYGNQIGPFRGTCDWQIATRQIKQMVPDNLANLCFNISNPGGEVWIDQLYIEDLATSNAVSQEPFPLKASNATLLRLGPMKQAPKIDGRIGKDEWVQASTTFGGISDQSGLMTSRKNNFRFGYDDKYLYFAITSELPLSPQKLTAKDTVEFIILPPKSSKPCIVQFDSTGKGTIASGVKIANNFAPDLVTSNQGECWTAEVAIPLSALDIKMVKDGETWGIQMIRHWSSDLENGFWHKPSMDGKLGTFIPDATAPAVSFDGFGHHEYESTGNYVWSYRVENTTPSPVKLVSGCYMVGITGAPTLDIKNPDLIGKATKHPIGRKSTLAPGKTGEFNLYLMAQFPGKPRLLFSQVRDAQTQTNYYTRTMFWDVGQAKRTAGWIDRLGLPYLCAGFYPSYGNKLRVAAVFSLRIPCNSAVITVTDTKGKIWKTLKYTNSEKILNDIEDETMLPNLPLGEYIVTLDATAKNGKHYTHKRTFAIRKFPWQNLNIGKERIIIPPFKPLIIDKSKKEVRALLTGYKLGGALWDAVYAEGKNILAAPIEFFLNGQKFSTGTVKLISAEPDRVVYESNVSQSNVQLQLKHEYDYDGFCKVTLRVVPQGKTIVKSFQLHIPLRDEYVRFYDPLNKSGARAKSAPSLAVPKGTGVLALPAVCTRKGRLENYFWFGGQYKGMCWMIDNDRHFSLSPLLDAQRLSRNKNTVTYTIDIVNKATTWEKPFEIVMGFEPTPVKPQPAGYRKIGEFMYDYPPPKNCDFAGMGAGYNMVNDLLYPLGTIPNGDMSYYKFLMASRNNIPTPKERLAFVNDYFARNADWIKKNMPFVDLSVLRQMLRDKRKYGQKYFLLYHNPALYSHCWPEAEMYKAEWLPWDYPVDDAANEYIATHTKEYIDKMLYEMREQARMGYDGMNFDCFPLGGGFNTEIGAGYRVKPGKVPLIYNKNMLSIAPPGIRSGKSLFTWRELTKRTATMLYMENKLVYGRPWVELHASHAQCVPITAFCSTTITWERGSGGGEYQSRFPESYILADIVGTQSGIIPRTIVSTKGAVKGISKADEVKSLIATSFGFALMNHSDQGVEGRHQEYASARDLVFSFGYGDPEVEIFPFWGKKKQPVSCNAKDIRMTVVVRPDGKGLLMIGNLGNKVKATFDLSGLGYKNCITKNAETDKKLSDRQKVTIEIPYHGYALILAEAVKETKR
ncbi:MAG: glycoside hydrolase domain-containing protein [Lentisphaeria bacterium]